MPKNRKIVLALDPGLRELGYAVFAGKKLVISGVRPLKLLPPDRRMSEARRQLLSWIAAYRPGTLVVEQTNRHPTGSFHSLHRLARSLTRIARGRGLSVTGYAPQTVRKHLVGNGKCTKKELAQALALTYPDLQVFVNQDRKWKERYFQNMFDAVGLGLYHRSKR